MANKEAKTKKENKNKKSYFKDFKAELKKVNWPTPKQLLNNTTAVVTIVIITAIIVFVLDIAFETLNKHGVDKIKEVITTDNTVVEDTTTDNTSEVVEGEETDNEENAEDSTVEGNTEASEENTTTENNAE